MRLILAIWLGKLILFLTQFLKKGGGSAAPGLYALKIEPNLVSKLSRQIPQNIVITGTNGKTTTSRMLNHLVKSQNIKTLRNSTGSNLERGVASTLIASTDWLGQIRDFDLGIWELDEAAFNTVVFEIKPQIMVFLNAFRDQLDRYGEVDTVVKKWWESLEKVDWDPTLIVNGGDTNTATIHAVNEDEDNPLKCLSFRVKNHVLWHESSISLHEKEHSNKKEPLYAEFLAIIKKNLGLLGMVVSIEYPAGKVEINIPVPGIYHIYDFLAAFSVYYLLRLPINNLQKDLGSFSPAFGRVEHIKVSDKDVYTFLIKNPAGANTVFETINPELKAGDRLLVALNDNLADGTDVSWIWDADFEILLGGKSIKELIETHFDYKSKPKKGTLFSDLKDNSKLKLETIISGKRANDLALRLKYAGFDDKNFKIEPNLEEAFNSATKDLDGRLFIFPTYTALLELQKILVQKGHKSQYWKEEN